MAFINTFRPTTQIAIQERADRAGLASLDTTLVLVGVQSGAATATVGELNDLLSPADAELLHGVGSELADMAAWAFKGVQDGGGACSIKSIALADVAGTARTITWTVTGPATAAGVLSVRIGGEVLNVNVASGATAVEVATDLTAAFDAAARRMVFTAAQGANPNDHIVTLTAVQTGVNSNDVDFAVMSEPDGITVVAAEGVAGVGASDYTATLALLEDEDIQYIAVANHTSTDVADALTHYNVVWSETAKRWRWVHFGSQSLTESDTLAAAADKRGIVLSCVKDSYNTPGQLAAYTAAIAATESIPNRPFDLMATPSLYLAPARLTTAEIETYGPRGITLLDLNARKTSMRIVRMVTTATTIDSVPDDSQLDVSISRSQVAYARQLDNAIESNFQRVVKSARDKARLRATAINIALQFEALRIFEGVQSLLDQFTVKDSTDDPSIPVDTVRLDCPVSVIPALRTKQATVGLIVR